MLPVHFGVGKENAVDIKVQWTDGEECSFPDVNVEGGPLFQISEDACDMIEF